MAAWEHRVQQCVRALSSASGQNVTEGEKQVRAACSTGRTGCFTREELVTDSLERRRSSPLSGRGRPFQKGNPGRKPGSKNRATIVAEGLLADEEAALIRKAVDLALAGDVQMLKFLIGRLLPRERPVRVALPLDNGQFDPVAASAAIVDAAMTGRIAPSEASALAAVVAAHARILDTTELGERLANIERDMRTMKDQI